MRLIILTLLVTGNLAFSSVREVLMVYLPLSFHGTDTAEEVGEEFMQAGIRSCPMVLSGAMPEVLVEAVGKPFRFTSIGGYPFEENNLLSLCKIGLDAEIQERDLTVTFDVSKLVIPEEVELSARGVLGIAIKAVNKTLRRYYGIAGVEASYRIVIVGTNEKNASLKDLATKITIKK